MTTIDHAQQLLIEAEKNRESYLQEEAGYQTFLSLPWYKKLFKEMEKPHFHYYSSIPLLRNWHQVIEIRMYYNDSVREITLALNEDNHGYRLNVDTGEKSSYLGSVNETVSQEFEELAEQFRKVFAKLIVE